MSRSSRTIRSPSTITRKFTGSFRAGCWGPISSSISGMLHTPRPGGLPVLPERVLSLRPILVQEQGARVLQSVELDPEKVVDLALVNPRHREQVRARREGGGGG